MNWQWGVFLIVNYVLAAYILRSMAASSKSKKNSDYDGLTFSFLVAPLWVLNIGIERTFRGLGRWISGD